MNLDSHLIVRTQPTARKKNTVLWGNYRITVLQDRLFRIEHNGRRKFRDEATQSVWYRDFGEIEFTLKREKERLVVQTKACSLILRKNRKDCAVLLNGQELPLTNAGNLKGTYRTLDQCDGEVWSDFIREKKKIRLSNGVCSKTGIALFDDAKSLTLATDGQVKAECGLGTDEYLFVYGNDYRAAVRALYLITGNVPLLPRYALGNWWSRYYPYSDEGYYKLLNRFEEHGVPLTVAAVDMDWHYSTNVDEEKKITESGRNEEYYGGNKGWTGYSWNKTLFPDYRKFLREVKSRKLKVMLNLHPADGVRWWEDAYPAMAQVMGQDPADGKQIPFDFSDPKFINEYFCILHRPYERDGVDFWWIDWQQGTKSNVEGLDPLWSLNHYHYLENAASQPNALILSRYAGIGSHRYPVGFSGDTVISWATLKYLVYFTQTATNVGYVWWSHDIGGHMMGTHEFELYLRHLQFGVFSPINRMHCSDMYTITKEPWAYPNGCGKIAEDWLRLRHAMIPFLYACNYRTAYEGRALIQPLYYQWSDCPEAYQTDEEYLFGESLLVAPVLTPLRKDGYSYTKVWLPEGKWTDLFTEDEYCVEEGGREITMMRRLDSVPVLAKAGALIPLSEDKGNGAENPVNLKILLYAGKGAFDLYEDALVNGKKKEAVTKLTSCLVEKEGICEQTLNVQTVGARGVVPKDRSIKVAFQSVSEGSVEVYEDGVRLPEEKLLTDTLSISFPVRVGKHYTVRATYAKKSSLEKMKERMGKILTECEDDNPIKFWHVYQPMMNLQSERELIEFIKKSALKECNKKRLLENL